MSKATINVPVSIDLSTIQKWMEKSDIVEVVRCGECIHASRDISGKWLWCGGVMRREDFFCKDGERKEDEDN